MDYRIDMKVYCTIPFHELPMRMPVLVESLDWEEVKHNGKYPSRLVIKPGYKSFTIECSEQEMEEFEEWALTRGGDIKILGTTEIQS